ncbi:endoribonuclease L-PSP [Parabacteroides sp. PF5-6]|uniref:chorismate transformation enzyme, FkbO/Hyg5 family n=1 Tax=Parabacteroides sp. PF5-6 TaxID=1742403 RepID=UPI0024053536|nr:endoribonuclease L-PSP [Parabacteroides sp. PF5-6]MDF9828783.1 hypothetical protein [Parabacteroides sp. PF5-6]
MNYCDKIRYHILTAEKASFPEMVDQLLGRLPANEAILRLAFFGTPNTNEEYLRRKNLLREKIVGRFGSRLPAISYVSQPPLDAPLIVEVHSFRTDPDDRLTYGGQGDFPYVVLENATGRFLFAGGFQGQVGVDSIREQSDTVFEALGEVLKKEQIPVNQIIRQWNYIERITDFEGDDQHYQSFNNSRSQFYAQTPWPKGYPAATGIGANLGGVLVDLDAVVFKTAEAFITPIDNKLQVAAHSYSDQVLESSDCRKTTPKFERAKSMTFGERRLVYISGTAAIRGEHSLQDVGLEKQLQITMENIAELIGEAKPVLLRVYLKYPEDYEEAARLMDSYALQIPISYMWADVCRDELLIEIEGIAVQ